VVSLLYCHRFTVLHRTTPNHSLSFPLARHLSASDQDNSSNSKKATPAAPSEVTMTARQVYSATRRPKLHLAPMESALKYQKTGTQIKSAM
jgi:hypothetical protein